MKGKLIRRLGVFMGVCLILTLWGGVLQAAQKDLTPFEFSQLSPDEKLKYRTVEIYGSMLEDWMVDKNAMTELMKDLPKSIALGNLEQPFLQFLETLWQLRNPKVKIMGEGHVGGLEIEEFMTDVAAGRAPGQIIPPAPPLAWHRMGAAADITFLMEEWEQLPKLLRTAPAVCDMCRDSDGRWWGYPSSMDSRGMVYNKDWFEEAGIFNGEGKPAPEKDWTWIDFREIAKKITNPKKNRWGVATPTTGTGTLQESVPSYMATSFGVLNPFCWAIPDESGKYTWRMAATPNLIELFQFLKDMRWEDESMLELSPGTWTWGIVVNELLPGRVGMALGSINVYGIWPLGGLDEEGKSMSEHLGFAPLPKHATTDLASSPLACNLYTMNPTYNREQLKAAFDRAYWYEIGEGNTLQIEYNLIRGKLFDNPTAYLGWSQLLWNPNFDIVYPVGMPAVEEYLPEEYIEISGMIQRLPQKPQAAGYELDLSFMGMPGILKPRAALIEAIVGNPNSDVKAELEKYADITNATVFNYKIKGDKEKFEVYYTALRDFYQEYYPEFYESEYFKREWNANHPEIWQ